MIEIETWNQLYTIYMYINVYKDDDADAHTYDSDADAAAYGGDELWAQKATVPPDPYSLD